MTDRILLKSICLFDGILSSELQIRITLLFVNGNIIAGAPTFGHKKNTLDMLKYNKRKCKLFSENRYFYLV